MVMYFEDFKIGSRFASKEREVTRADIEEFAHLTGDQNKLHVDPDFALKSGYSGVIAHGLLTLSIALGLWHSLDLTNGTIIAFAGLNNVSFRAPVYPNDKLQLIAEVSGKRESRSRPQIGLLTLKMSLIDKEKGIPVLEAEPVLMLQRKGYP